jgi:hypothetical protein
MMRSIGFILASIICGCGDSRLRNQSIEDCDFEFQIVVRAPNSYNYDSRSGKLQKLIEVDQYSDTTLLLSTKTICMLASMCEDGKLINFPDTLVQEGAHIKPAPSYELHFTTSGRTKSILWDEKTTWLSSEALQLQDILYKIDSLIVASQEFKALPASRFVWE